MLESLGGLGGYGIASVLMVVVTFLLFAKFVKKIIGNIIMVAIFGVPGTLILAILDVIGH